MRPLHSLTVMIILLTAAAGLAAQSQITTGVVDAIVLDTSGAVLPGVDVEIRNVDTNLTRNLTTDRDGRFVALQLPPGRYTVTLKLAGFATVVQENVILTVGETVRLNTAMKVSGVAETVTVTSVTPAIDITLEAVKEFQVIATGASAEFGRTAGGVVNVITKSGTNQVKGSLFHYQRLEGLASNTSDGKPLDDFRREQSGGTIGGPLIKDKAFYFLAFEGVYENLLRPNLSQAIG